LVIGSYSVDATAGVVVEGLVSVGLVVVLVVAVVLVVLVRLAQTIWELSVDIAVKFSRMASPPPRRTLGLVPLGRLSILRWCDLGLLACLSIWAVVPAL